MIKEFETFYATAWKNGNSLVMTIPDKLVKYVGIEEGEPLKVMLQKHQIIKQDD